jgi:hypothetical protein
MPQCINTLMKAPVGSGGKMQLKLRQLLISLNFHQTSEDPKGHKMLDSCELLATLPKGLFEGDSEKDISEFHERIYSETCIGSLFKGELQISRTCKTCNTKNHDNQYFFELKLKRPKGNESLEELLLNYFSPTNISRHCSMCDRNAKHSLQVSMKKVPDILALNLLALDTDKSKGMPALSADQEISIECNRELHKLRLVTLARRSMNVRSEEYWTADCLGYDDHEWNRYSNEETKKIDPPVTAASLMFFSKEFSMPAAAHMGTVKGNEILSMQSASCIAKR